MEHLEAEENRVEKTAEHIADLWECFQKTIRIADEAEIKKDIQLSQNELIKALTRVLHQSREFGELAEMSIELQAKTIAGKLVSKEFSLTDKMDRYWQGSIPGRRL